MLARNMEFEAFLNCTNNNDANSNHILGMMGRWRTGQVQQPEQEQQG